MVVAHRDQLRDDAHGHFARLASTDVQTDRRMDGLRALSGLLYEDPEVLMI